MLVIPTSLREEHKEIMGSLREFAVLPGATGRVIMELLDVLEPHFEKEEKLAMPVLGSISELVSGDHVIDLREIAESQGALLSEYDKMFEEHSELKKFIVRAQKIARHEKYEEVVNLLDVLTHHSKVEEEVLYPAALLARTVANCLMPSRDQMVGIS